LTGRPTTVGLPSIPRLAADRFGLGTLTGPPTKLGPNYSNAIWRVDTTRGRFAVKCLLGVLDVAALEAAVGFEQAAVHAGFPAAAPESTPADELLVPVDVGGRAGFVRAHRWVDGAVLGEGPGHGSVRSADAAAAGGYLARLHHLGAEHASASGAPARCSSGIATRPIHWARYRPHAGRSGPLAVLDDDAFALLESLPPPAAAAAECFCHADFKPENAVRAGAGLVVLDWDQACRADPAVELAIAALRWAGVSGGALHEPRFRAFLRGYRKDGGPVSALTQRHFAASARLSAEWIDFNARQALGELPGVVLDAASNIAATLAAIRAGLDALPDWAALAAEALACRSARTAPDGDAVPGPDQTARPC